VLAARAAFGSSTSGLESATVGGEVTRAGAVTFEVITPLPGDIQLVGNGRVIARAVGQACKHLVTEPGVYRVQVYPRRQRLDFSNPIFVR